MGQSGNVYSGREAKEGLQATYEGEVKVGRERKRKLAEWDKMLKNFRYGDALDSVMRSVRPFPSCLFSVLQTDTPISQDVTPATAFALMEELIRRDGLPIALANRHDLSLEPVLAFLVKHITSPRYCTLAVDIATVLIGSSAFFVSSPFSPRSSESSVRRTAHTPSSPFYRYLHSHPWTFPLNRLSLRPPATKG
jgi:U3 small nucleolar RNA-associated protein 15